jgi:hypothetical protein
MSERRLTDAEIAATDANVDGSSMPDVWKRTIRALLAEVRAHRAASEGEVSCVQCAQNDDCPGFDACPWLPRGGDDVAGALRDLLLSADCTWESIGGGHDWREACDRARAALALHRSGGGDDVVRALRPEVLAFAHAMETELRANDHKGGWRDSSTHWLLERMNQERRELTAAVDHTYGTLPHTSAREKAQAAVLSEAADTANFAMMIADVCGALALHRSGGGDAREAGRSDLPDEIRAILRDVAHGVHGSDLSGRAAAAIVRRDLCPRCAGTGCDTPQPRAPSTGVETGP